MRIVPLSSAENRAAKGAIGAAVETTGTIAAISATTTATMTNLRRPLSLPSSTVTT
ncbi:hypothetical protein GCM10009761_12900 [Agromyces terreus]